MWNIAQDTSSRLVKRRSLPQDSHRSYRPERELRRPFIPTLNTYHSDQQQVALVNAQQSVKDGQKIFHLLKALGTTEPDVKTARQNLHRNIGDPETTIKINEGIEEQREHFDNLALHIGYIYGSTQIPNNASVFHPVCAPGARLPHAWIRAPSR
ncbi:hypothetical protein BDV12DRAFT_197680 [Aspergillus spectabilis]